MRIVTLRNFAWFSLVALLVFAAISVRSELRGRHMHDYGRLTDRQIETKVEAPKPVEVVEETTPPAASQPMTAMTIIPTEQSTVATAMPMPAMPPPRGEGRVVIVGGPEGVSIVRQERRRPLLSGGFGR